MSLPYGFHYCGPEDFSGYDRLTVENEAEVELAFIDHAQPTLSCGYCTATLKTRSKDLGLRWWHAHDCDHLQTAEAHAMVVDLTPMLKQSTEVRQAA